MSDYGRATLMCAMISLCVTGLAASAPSRAQMVVPKKAPMTGAKLFGQQCGACHSTKPDETRVGPSLAGFIGRKAGTSAGYSYSAALKRSGITWNRASLDKWLTGSTAAVPGTKMVYVQADPAKRKAIIDYLDSM